MLLSKQRDCLDSESCRSRERSKEFRPRPGGVYGFITPTVNASKPAGEWNTFEVTLIGYRVTIVLNGRTTIQGRLIDGITGGALDSHEDKPGPIMIQGDHGPVYYRDIMLTPAK